MRQIMVPISLLAVVAWTSPAAEAGPARFTRHHSSERIVLGSTAYYAPESRGWGAVRPATIFNGGDPNGLVSHIRWHHWGRQATFGWGVTSIFKPDGGYYSRQVRAELRASDIGRCTPRGPLAYRRLWVREPARPGGPLRPWTPWVTGNICRTP